MSTSDLYYFDRIKLGPSARVTTDLNQRSAAGDDVDPEVARLGALVRRVTSHSADAAQLEAIERLQLRSLLWQYARTGAVLLLAALLLYQLPWAGLFNWMGTLFS